MESERDVRTEAEVREVKKYHTAGFAGGGRGCRRPLEAGRGRTQILPWSLRRTEPFHQVDFSPVTLILDF